ncbi:hypothetical protein HMN09_00919400 [Mycena chlorophos]|uniref:Uncharacterized protein n=1 Tax=Mycena chlorophos TaxID=658473 RepID=A0A8H6W2A4_MYCCL|nr:hypothetical protein HMN09_00919400 [Mycena chlorophos]
MPTFSALIQSSSSGAKTTLNDLSMLGRLGGRRPDEVLSKWTQDMRGKLPATEEWVARVQATVPHTPEQAKAWAAAAATPFLAATASPTMVALVNACGWGAKGVLANSLASGIQSAFYGGYIFKGCFFSVLQSVGAGGPALTTAASVVTTGVAFAGGATTLYLATKAYPHATERYRGAFQEAFAGWRQLGKAA